LSQDGACIMKKRARFIRIASAACACIALAAAPAYAQDGEAIEQAKTFFNAGAQAYAAGQYTAAMQAFEEAYKRAPRPQILFSLAQAQRKQYYVTKQSDVARSAIAHYREYLAQVPSGGRRADAADAIAELEPQLGHEGAGAETTGQVRAEVERTRIMVTSETPGAVVSLDDAPPVATPLVAEVKPGNHRVRVAADGYYEDERVVVALKDTLIPTDIPLREKPAIVSFDGGAGAEVSIDGRLAGVAPLPRPIELSPGTHAIVFTKNGMRAVTLTPKLVHGQQVTLTVRLERTSQRVASYALLGGGAVITLAGAVFAGVALIEQQNAKQILDDKSRGNIDGAALSDYNSSIDARDKWRGASIAGLTIGAAVIATGALLYVFDRPNASTLPPAEEERAPPPKPPAPRLRETVDIAASPLVAPGLYGVSLGGRF
jgi:tetratricopeptide (TPR) repeat protein